MTRLRFISNAGSGGGGGGGPGGDTVTLGPEFGEADLNTFTLDPSFTSMRLGPFGNDLTLNPNLDQLRMGPFANDFTLNPNLDRLSVGPIVNNLNLSVASGLVLTDLNPDVDFYTDENTPTTNFGTADPLLSKTNGAIGNNEQYVYIAWNLTGYTGTTFTAGTLRISTRTTALLAESANYDIRTIATQPFVEGTANWNNVDGAGVPGTSRQTGSVSTPTAFAVQSIVLNATALANAPGNWMFIRVANTSLLGASTTQVHSKETATATDRPRLDLSVTVTT